jgi:Domain of unknown function (DUF4878)
MKLLFLIPFITLCACNTQNFLPAQSALDAAREYKTACLNGDFDKAIFYIVPNNNNTIYLKKIRDNYTQLSSSQKKENKEASLIIYAVKKMANSTTQVILSNSYTQVFDTILVVKQNDLWQVQLK